MGGPSSSLEAACPCANTSSKGRRGSQQGDSMGTGADMEGFSEEVSLERALKDDGRRGPTATWRSSPSRGLGLEGTWGSRTRADPGAGAAAGEPLQGSRLKTVREKPRRKAQCRPHGSERGIYYGPSPNNAEAEVEAEDAVSRLSFVPVRKILAHVQCGAGQHSQQHQPDSASCPCPSSPAAPTAGRGGSVPPACRPRPHDLL